MARRRFLLSEFHRRKRYNTLRPSSNITRRKLRTYGAKLQIARNNLIPAKSKLRFYGRFPRARSTKGLGGNFDSASKLIKKRPISRVLEPSATKRNPVTSFSAMNSSRTSLPRL